MSKKKKESAAPKNEEDEMGAIKADRNSEISADSILDVLGGLDQPQNYVEDPEYEGEQQQQVIDLYAERKEEEDEG